MALSNRPSHNSTAPHRSYSIVTDSALVRGQKNVAGPVVEGAGKPLGPVFLPLVEWEFLRDGTAPTTRAPCPTRSARTSPTSPVSSSSRSARACSPAPMASSTTTASRLSADNSTPSSPPAGASCSSVRGPWAPAWGEWGFRRAPRSSPTSRQSRRSARAASSRRTNASSAPGAGMRPRSFSSPTISRTGPATSTSVTPSAPSSITA